MSYDHKAIYRKAESLRARRRYKRAIKEYQKIIAIDPEDTKVQARLADLFSLTKQRQEALEYYEKVAEKLIKKDRPDKLAPVLRQMIDLDPLELQRYKRLGDLYREHKTTADVIKLYRDGLVTFKSRRFDDKKIVLYRWILDLKPKDQAATLQLIKLYRKSKRPKEALTLLKQALPSAKASYRRQLNWQLFRLQPTASTFFTWLLGR